MGTWRYSARVVSDSLDVQTPDRCRDSGARTDLVRTELALTWRGRRGRRPAFLRRYEA